MLGPVLFVMYINDLPKCASCRIRVYAIDTQCFSRINCLEDVDACKQNIGKLMSAPMIDSSVSTQQSVR